MINTRHAVQVRMERSGQTSLGSDACLCSMPPAALSSMGLALGDQVRIEVTGKDEYALYSVIETSAAEVSDDIVRMNLSAMKRVGATADFAGILDTAITRCIPHDEDAADASEFVERLDETDDKHRGLIVCAPHGGMIEPFTRMQAEHVLAILKGQKKDISCWCCKGWRQNGGAYERWHITSTRLSPRSFPLLGQLQNRAFRYAVSFHGYSGGGTKIQIGGSAPDSLKRELADALRALKGLARRVEMAKPGSDHAGEYPANFVNWLTARGTGGVQIEQPLDVREEHHAQIAGAVAAVFAAHL